MRSPRTLLLGVLLVALAACGGQPASSNADESTGGEPTTTESSGGEPSTAETPDDGGPGSLDMDTLIAELVPPNSTEISRTEAGTSVLIGYESTDTVGDLRGFYIQKIADLDLNVLTTTEAANTYAVAFGTNEAGTGLGGTIAVQNSGDVSTVLVTVAEGS